MPPELVYTLINMLTAETVPDIVLPGLSAFVRVVRPDAACLLLWDDELGRYIVGETWADHADEQTPAAFRRRALRAANRAARDDTEHARCLERSLYYQPLNSRGTHVGAYVAAVDTLPLEDSSYTMLLKSTGHALLTGVRLRQADQEKAELDAEHERLEELLKAVEQQQRTIDRLLAYERQFSASLEAEVEARTAALQDAQKRLIQSEKLAVIGQLASSLAHELNNPLQAIKSGLGLIADDIESGDVQRPLNDLHIIRSELERIESIFHQMLDFYRPVSYERCPLDLNAICEGVRVLMRKRLQEARITLSMDLNESLPQTCGDSNQIKQVLLNLMLNAVDAMPDGGEIHVRTAVDANVVCLSVADNGPGISAEYHPRLFEPLFTTKTRGLGLGLAISREIAERHDGDLSVHSLTGQGTTFTLKLPIKGRCDDD
jgi:signal transduction histidine kinase